MKMKNENENEHENDKKSRRRDLRKRLCQTFTDQKLPKKKKKKQEENPHGYRFEQGLTNDVVYLLTFASYVDVNKHGVC